MPGVALGVPRLLGRDGLARRDGPSRRGSRTSSSTCSSRERPTRTARADRRGRSTPSAGDMNAFTTKEYTAFYVRPLAERPASSGSTSSRDIMLDPALRPDEVDAERQVILEEVLMHLDEPADVVQERFAEAMFPGHPLGREVLGDPEVITLGDGARDPVVLRRALPAGEHRRRRGGRRRSRPPRRGLEGRFAGAERGGPPVRTAPGRRASSRSTCRPGTPSRRTSSLGVRAPDRRSPERFALAAAQPQSSAAASRAGCSRRSARSAASPTRSSRTGPPTPTPGRSSVSVGTSPDTPHEVLDLVLAELDELAAARRHRAGARARQGARQGRHPAQPGGLGRQDVAHRREPAAARRGARASRRSPSGSTP